MASTLYENVEDWHTSGESRDLISSGETESLSFKGDVEDHDDGFEEMNPKQHSLLEITEKEPHTENETTKENGHDYNGLNGNGVHEEHGEDECDDGDGNNEDDDIVEDQDNGEENDSDRASAERNEDEPAPPVPYYGRTLVAPEYMNFQLPEETSQREEKDTEDKDDGEIAVADESDDLSPSENNQVEEKQVEEQRAEEETSGQTVQKEVLEEDDITVSEEESDEDDNVVEQDESVTVDRQVEEEKEEEEEDDDDDEEEGEDEGEEEEEDEGEEEVQEESKEEDNEAGEGEVLEDTGGSPLLAQEEDDEEQNEEDGPEENEDNGVKEENLLKENEEVEENESNEDMQQETQNETCRQLDKSDDDESDDHDELIDEDMAATKESILEHSDSLQVNVASPTRDISEVGSAVESFDDGEGVTTEDDDVDKVEQEETAREQSSNETDEEDEETRKTFNGPVEEYERQPNKDEEGDEMAREGESCQSDDSEEDGGDDTAPIVCVPDQEEAAKEDLICDDDQADGSVDLEPIPEGEDAESDREAQGEDEYSVHIKLQGHDDDSDLTGKVKELGRMFEGGGPVFPKTAKNDDTDAVDGSPVSVRRYKAIFEQDKMSAARAREPGRREELTGPPRGIVKNLRGMFENPQGFEARKG